MDKFIISIINIHNTLQEVAENINTKFGFIFKKKERKQFEYMKNEVIEKIKNYDMFNGVSNWSVEYLYKLEHTLTVYYTILHPYLKSIYIPELEDLNEKEILEKINLNYFMPIYFKIEEKSHLIMLDINSNNINFTVFNEITGESFTSTSENTTSKSQNIMESICKEYLKVSFINFISSVKIDKK